MRPTGALAGVPIPRKLFRTGEIIEHTGISRQTLHTYTLLGLITEERSTLAGHRLYDESVFGQLTKIQELKRQNKTLREIRDILDVERQLEDQTANGRHHGKKGGIRRVS